MQSNIMTLKEVAERLKLSQKTVRGLARLTWLFNNPEQSSA